jgi:ribosomal protein S19
MSILIYKNDQQEGPYDLDTIREGLSIGRFTPEDFAFQEGCTDWVPLRSLLPSILQPLAIPTHAISNKIEKKIEQIDSTLAGLLGDEQDPGVVEKVSKKAKELLTKGEQIEYIGVQKKPLITIAPDAILLTNKRFMIVRPKMLGMTFEDHVWREVSNIHMSEQMLTATISCVIVGGKKLEIDSIPKRQARRIYAYAQEVEERMHEERRARDMEEKRAAAGGIVIQSPVGMPMQQNAPLVADDPMAVLGKLKKMLDAGLIESNEYEAKKAEILGRM